MSGQGDLQRLRRRQRAGAANRAIGWVLFPVVVAADLMYRFSHEGTEMRGVAWVLQIAMIVLLFVHAGFSFYVFGMVRPRRTLRVFHIYFGYATLLLVLVSQTTFGIQPLHYILTVLMYLCIVIHIVLGMKFTAQRRAAAASGTASLA